MITSEDEAINDCSCLSELELTNLMWALLTKPLFVISKMDVTIRNKAQIPICSGVRILISITKLINPKIVREKRRSEVYSAECIQYEAKGSFKS